MYTLTQATARYALECNTRVKIRGKLAPGRPMSLSSSLLKSPSIAEMDRVRKRRSRRSRGRLRRARMKMRMPEPRVGVRCKSPELVEQHSLYVGLVFADLNRICVALGVFWNCSQCCGLVSYSLCFVANMFSSCLFHCGLVLDVLEQLHLVPGPRRPWYTPVRARVQTWYTLLPSESNGCPSLGLGIPMVLSREIGKVIVGVHR